MHYLCKISSVTVLSHRRGTIHSIFKIGISRNMKCAYMVGFLKYSHIYSFTVASYTVSCKVNFTKVLQAIAMYVCSNIIKNF